MEWKLTHEFDSRLQFDQKTEEIATIPPNIGSLSNESNMYKKLDQLVMLCVLENDVEERSA